MTVKFDDKGKFYTEVISKDPIKSVIQTITHQIQGTVFVKQGDRLIDELNSSEKFIAVTDAVVYNLIGKQIASSQFLTVNCNHIIWLLPQQETPEEKAKPGGEG